VVSVTDYGIGINKSEQQKIFERFYRVEGRNELTYPGFGIGLFIANEIIQRHNGTIRVESEKDKKTVFTFTLPLMKQNNAQ
jgi:signal transduction histidine kinase